MLNLFHYLIKFVHEIYRDINIISILFIFFFYFNSLQNFPIFLSLLTPRIICVTKIHVHRSDKLNQTSKEILKVFE